MYDGNVQKMADVCFIDEYLRVSLQSRKFFLSRACTDDAIIVEIRARALCIRIDATLTQRNY